MVRSPPSACVCCFWWGGLCVSSFFWVHAAATYKMGTRDSASPDGVCMHVGWGGGGASLQPRATTAQAPRQPSTTPTPTQPAGSTCILRFTAGPPYEDIAFRIINKEW